MTELDLTAWRELDRRATLALDPQEVRTRPATERRCDFDETILGFTPETVIKEARRCLQCPAPQACVEACPVHNPIPEILWLVAHGDFLAAAWKYRETSNLPEICGRVCPHPCMSSDVVGRRKAPINLERIEQFVMDYAIQHYGHIPTPEPAPPTGYSVGIVGSGPAGLAAAEQLALKGHSVVVYERMPKPGGLLRYGIPNFKLDKRRVLDRKIRQLEQLGIEFRCNVTVGKDITVDELTRRHDALFIAVGTWVEAPLKVPGVNLDGIYKALDFLMRANVPLEDLPPEKRSRPRVGRRVAIIGGGDTATDCARTAVRLGAEEVTIVYRRSAAEMPGTWEDRQQALEEGVRIEYLTAPVRFLGNDAGQVRAMECVRMRLGAPDESGRRRPIPIEGSNFIMNVDTVILAIGFWPDPLIGETTPGLKTHKWGLIVIDPETCQTSREGIFAGGDAVRGPDLVVDAMADGRRAAEHIHAYLLRQGSTRTSPRLTTEGALTRL